MLLLVGVAFDRLVGLDAMLDAPETGSDRRGERNVWIDVRRGDPILDALRFFRPRYDPQSAGAVLVAPGRIGRRPESRDQPRVGIHRARDHRQQFGHQRLLAADPPAHDVGDAMILGGVMKDRLAALGQRAVNVARLARPVARPFRHEGRHPSAALRQNFRHRLEQRRLVGSGKRVVHLDGGFEHAGAGFGVKALELHVHRAAGVEQFVIELGVNRRPQHRIAVESRRDVPEVAIALLAHGMRRLVEQEELELDRAQHVVSHVLGPLQHAAQRPARADVLVLAGEFAEHQRQIVFKRQQPGRLRQQAHRGVRIGGMPARHRDVVVQLIVAVPAQHHVAEAEALLQRRQEFVAAHVFAAHDAIDVEHADLDVIEIPLDGRNPPGPLPVLMLSSVMENVSAATFRHTRNPRQN